MDIIWYSIGAIVCGFLAGGTSVIFIWLLYNKLKDRSLRKNMPIDELIKQVENTKPIIDERGKLEDERNRIDKIRQFEKLRRTGGDELKTSKPTGFYSRTFGESERVSLSNKDATSIKQDSTNNRPTESNTKRTIRFD